jgi:cytochrome c oxidase subunit II
MNTMQGNFSSRAASVWARADGARTRVKGAWGRATLAVGAGLFAALARAADGVKDLPGGPAVNQLDLHPPMSAIAVEQRWLHNFMMIVCLAIFVIVFAFMFWSIFAHRKSRGAKAANFHESTAVEIAWTIVPFFIVIAMALPATKVVVAMKDTSNADITIKATGYQWKWGYDYLNGEGAGIGFLSTLDVAHREMSNSGKPPPTDNYLLKVDNPMVVPVDRKVRIITTANDVIHAWMVPALGVKQDAIPGFVRDTWFRAQKTGDFYGQCAELCGKEHAYMPIHVKVVTQEQYALWVAGEKKKLADKADDPSKEWTLSELAARGEKVYSANCVACHQATGMGAGPIKALLNSPVVLDADRGKLVNVLLNGQNNGAMPAWKQLSDTELAAVSTYVKNAWTNKTGHLLQPADVTAVRAGKAIAAGAAATAAVATAVAAPAAATPATTTTAASAAGLPVSVLFAVGKSELDAAAKKAVGEAVIALKAAPDAKIALSGFVDASGSAAQNAELAKQRAFAVRDALQAAGIDAQRIELRKPENITAGTGADAAQARRVDIVAR